MSVGGPPAPFRRWAGGSTSPDATIGRATGKPAAASAVVPGIRG
jgi:hypothetical protein